MSEAVIEEKFALTSQARKAAISVAANITEGFKKRSKREKVNFYNISQGSLEELRYYLILAKDLKYVNEAKQAWGLSEEIGRMLHKLIQSVGRN